ncbi:CdaR family transcriptional regulator [Streptomyces sp. NPDC057651]|uniref:CdaR family transcriptional regulator n=1 Tax=Streptomyces sp. NPDC057651 TaxID=3346194 RepID=UPI00369C29B1
MKSDSLPLPVAASAVLTPKLAHEIAQDISRIVGFNVLITDADAVVIGSGDPARLGTVHEASLDVLRTLRPTAHTAAQARPLSGVRPGVSLPLLLGDEAVGTVGLTGAPARVRQFGLVVQRQTEILLQEAAATRSRMLHAGAVHDLLRGIAYYDPDLVDATTLSSRMTELGFSPALPRRALLLGTRAAAGGPETPDVSPSAVLRAAGSVFGHRQDLLGHLDSGNVFVLHHDPDGRFPERCAQLCALLAERAGAHPTIGHAEPATGPAALHAAYQDAAAALRLGPRLDASRKVFAAHEVRVPQLLASVPPQARSRFRDAVLGTLPEAPDWPQLRETLIAWAEGGFSLVGAARLLHIHRNTLLYRLDKITRLSGRPVREPADGIALYLACRTEP